MLLGAMLLGAGGDGTALASWIEITRPRRRRQRDLGRMTPLEFVTAKARQTGIAA